METYLKAPSKGTGTKTARSGETEEVSYGACGLPYYVAGINDDIDLIRIRKKAEFEASGIHVQLGREAVSADFRGKFVTARLSDGGEECYSYDKLVIATGASPFLPPVPGLELKNVFVMRTPDDAIALREALEAGEIAAAGLDVLEKEPLEPSNPLGRIQDSTRLIITPHLAWASVEARRRCVQEAYENIAAFLRGEARNVVNP